MATNPAAERLQSLIGQAPDQLTRLQEISTTSARNEARRESLADERTPGGFSGIISGPIARAFGAEGAEQRAGAAGDAAAEQAILDAEGARLGGQALIGASGVDLTQLEPQRAAALQTLAVTDPLRAEAEINEIQAAQSINITPAQVRTAQRAAVDLSRASVDLRIATQTERQALIKSSMDALSFQRASGMGMTPQLLTSTADMLFDDRSRDMAPYKDQLASFDQLQSIINTESGPASMAVLFKFIKSMDDSVVRESEGRLLSSSSGPVRELVNAFNKIAGGGLFDQQTRDEINQAATNIARASFATAKQINDDHDQRAARFAEQFQTPAIQTLSAGTGFDPTRTFTEIEIRQRGGSAQGIIPDDEIPEGFEAVR